MTIEPQPGGPGYATLIEAMNETRHVQLTDPVTLDSDRHIAGCEECQQRHHHYWNAIKGLLPDG